LLWFDQGLFFAFAPLKYCECFKGFIKHTFLSLSIAFGLLQGVGLQFIYFSNDLYFK
jgi:hypothetical protein